MTTVKDISERIEKAVAVIQDAVEQFQPKWVFALFSGGHDSLTSSYVASLHPDFSGCVHINTGIGIPATRQFVIDTCSEWKWKLFEYKASGNTKADGTPDPMDYETEVMKVGFPGADQHRIMYSKLKERQVRRLMREHAGRVLLITGARQQESTRRMGHVSPIQKRGRAIWVNPIWDWSKSECSEALTTRGFRRNETALRFGRSGECLCGAFASPGELSALEFACPASAQRLKDLEKRVRAAGFPWGWEEGPPDWWKEKNQGQRFMFGYDQEVPDPEFEEHLCTSCKWRAL